jgi:hypothetical protein
VRLVVDEFEGVSIGNKTEFPFIVLYDYFADVFGQKELCFLAEFFQSDKSSFSVFQLECFFEYLILLIYDQHFNVIECTVSVVDYNKGVAFCFVVFENQPEARFS